MPFQVVHFTGLLAASTLISAVFALPPGFTNSGNALFERDLSRRLNSRQLRARASPTPGPSSSTVALATDALFTTCPNPTEVTKAELDYGPGSYGAAPNTATTLTCTYPSTDPTFDEMVCTYDAVTGDPSQYNQPACSTQRATEPATADICYTTCTGPLVESVTVTLSADGDTAETGCYVGGVGICMFDAREGGTASETDGPLDCSRVSVEEGKCLEDYVKA